MWGEGRGEYAVRKGDGRAVGRQTRQQAVETNERRLSPGGVCSKLSHQFAVVTSLVAGRRGEGAIDGVAAA